MILLADHIIQNIQMSATILRQYGSILPKNIIASLQRYDDITAELNTLLIRRGELQSQCREIEESVASGRDSAANNIVRVAALTLETVADNELIASLAKEGGDVLANAMNVIRKRNGDFGITEDGGILMSGTAMGQFISRNQRKYKAETAYHCYYCRDIIQGIDRRNAAATNKTAMPAGTTKRSRVK